jgi:hypothetical protein
MVHWDFKTKKEIDEYYFDTEQQSLEAYVDFFATKYEEANKELDSCIQKLSESEARLAKAQKLIKKWRDNHVGSVIYIEPHSRGFLYRCADELEKVLE